MIKQLTIILTVPLMIWALSACDESTGTDDSQKGTGNNELTAGDDDACGEPTYASVGWEDALEGGGTPKALFEQIEGECSSAFTWDISPFGTQTDTPQSGETEMHVSVVFDQTQTRVGRYEAIPSGGGDRDCPSYFVEATATVTLASADGAFVDSGQVTVKSSDSTATPTLSLKVPLEDISGTLNVPLSEGETGALTYYLTGSDTECAGSVQLSTTKSNGDGTADSGAGEIGSWSSTSCAMGETEVDLETPLPDGETVNAAIADSWTDVSFDGVWDDDETTTLQISAETTQTIACQTRTTTLVPVLITYSTSGGRITETQTKGTIDVSFDATGNVRSMQLWLSHDQNCSSVSDVIPYTGKSCEILEGVTIQLGIDLTADGEIQVSDEGLMVYEYHRSGDAAPGAADNVATLSLSR